MPGVEVLTRSKKKTEIIDKARIRRVSEKQKNRVILVGDHEETFTARNPGQWMIRVIQDPKNLNEPEIIIRVPGINPRFKILIND